LRRTCLAACAALAATAALLPSGAAAALLVPHAEAVREAPVVPHSVGSAPAAPAPAGLAPASPATSGVGRSGGGSASSPTQQAPAPDPSRDLEADARHRFAGTPDFYQRNPVGSIFGALPMVDPLADQLHAYIAEQRDILATAEDLESYLEVMGRIADAEAALSYVEGWTATLSPDVEAEARHRFAGTPDFYQRDPVEAIFSSLPTAGEITSIADRARAGLEAARYSADPEAYFQALRNLAGVEEMIGRLDEAHEVQARLETRAIFGYSEVGERACPDFGMSASVEPLPTSGACF